MIESASDKLYERCAGLVDHLGLARRENVREVRPLTGGVASDIASIRLGDRTVCAKFALEKLRVAEDWHAPVGRNAAEYGWLEFAGDTVPGCAPRLFGRDAERNGFIMEYLHGDDVYLWKTALLERQPTRGEAAKVGDVLGRIHKASAAPEFEPSRFQNQADFYDLRLEPYLAFTASRHPDLANTLHALIDVQASRSSVLIHGDVSPKNILFKDGQPVFLDAECATMGDPSFDVAFCLNHFLLKAFHMPDRADELMSELASFWTHYSEHVSWEDTRRLESSVSALLPALMLARVDGKSPVEYLDESTRAGIRDFAIPLIHDAPGSLEDIESLVRRSLS